MHTHTQTHTQTHKHTQTQTETHAQTILIPVVDPGGSLVSSLAIYLFLLVLGDIENLKWEYNMRKISQYNFIHGIPCTVNEEIFNGNKFPRLAEFMKN